MNNFTVDNTVIIIGKSPIIDDVNIYTKLPDLQSKFHNIGINQIAIPLRTEYIAFVDKKAIISLKYIHLSTKIISIDKNATTSFEGDFYRSDHIPLDKPPFYNNTYSYYGFTHDICISWAYKNNFKNIILVGVADFTENSVYSSFTDGLPNMNSNFHYHNDCKAKSIKFIENAQKYINIYTINPKSVLNVPRISLDLLLK